METKGYIRAIEDNGVVMVVVPVEYDVLTKLRLGDAKLVQEDNPKNRS